MIKIISGSKGFGKTKIIIDEANNAVKVAKGHVVFINDTKRYMYDIAREVRVVDTKDFQVVGEEAFLGFLKGIIACNSDTQFFYIDGTSRITGKSVEELSDFFYNLEKLVEDFNLTVTLTISCETEKLPDFVKKFV